MTDKEKEEIFKNHKRPNWRQERLDEEPHLYEKDEAWLRKFIGDSGMEKFGSAIREAKERRSRAKI